MYRIHSSGKNGVGTGRRLSRKVETCYEFRVSENTIGSLPSVIIRKYVLYDGSLGLI